jgi:hypothetical protein
LKVKVSVFKEFTSIIEVEKLNLTQLQKELDSTGFANSFVYEEGTFIDPEEISPDNGCSGKYCFTVIEESAVVRCKHFLEGLIDEHREDEEITETLTKLIGDLEKETDAT